MAGFGRECSVQGEETIYIDGLRFGEQLSVDTEGHQKRRAGNRIAEYL